MSDELPFTDPARVRYFEDYRPGDVHELGSVGVHEAEMLAFAARYDPQIIHTDPARAAEGPYGGLIASGWQTGGLMMRLYAAHYLSDASSLGSPGMEELKWLAPVRPGDILHVQVRVVDTKRSRSKPDRGIVHSDVRVRNQDGEEVMTMRPVNLILCKNPAP